MPVSVSVPLHYDSHNSDTKASVEFCRSAQDDETVVIKVDGDRELHVSKEDLNRAIAAIQ